VCLLAAVWDIKVQSSVNTGNKGNGAAEDDVGCSAEAGA